MLALSDMLEKFVREHPAVNASYGDECVIEHERVNIGLAVDVAKSDGSRTLVGPVLRHADLGEHVELFIHEDGDEVEFVTLLRFDSMDAVKEFAGSDETRPVIFPGVEKLLTRMEPARHYRITI